MMAAQVTGYALPLGALLGDWLDVGRHAELPITAVTLDSRRVADGTLFIARAGSRAHGLSYLDEAVARGAAAVLAEAEPAGVEMVRCHGRAVPLIRVARADLAGRVAARFYGEPSAAMHVIGVTGTNGKTSVSHFIAQSLAATGPCGLIGTLGSGLVGQLSETGHTTPDPVTLQAELARQRDAGARWTVMEVSSHALDQQRVAGVAFDTAVFTNLTHEHLDYHGDMDSYAAAKRRLFGQSGLRHAVINADDPIGSDWLADLADRLDCLDYGIDDGHGRPARLRGRQLHLDAEGINLEIDFPLHRAGLRTGLLGRFNAYNLLAAAGALLAAGMAFDEVIARLGRVQTVPGRMERFGGRARRPLVVVDYAHTPDALEHVLQALGEHCRGRLWCVFGCGGDRDAGKRPLMGRIAEHHADSVVITDDNPRSEDPYTIIEAIQRGMADPDASLVIRDRAQAIAHAIDSAGAGDVVLVAGKGHETEQLVGDQRLPFSDRQTVAHLIGRASRD